MPDNTMQKKTVACVICGKSLELENADAPVTIHDGRECMQIVYDGVVCIAHGNYGSMVWDPMGREPLLGFVICDECFRKAKPFMVPIK